jgi:hypothetical protein
MPPHARDGGGAGDGRQTLATGSHEPLSHCAELTAGLARTTTVIDANSTTTAADRRMTLFIAGFIARFIAGP